MLERLWGKWNTPLLLVGVQTYTATLEISMVVSQRNWESIYLKTHNTTLGMHIHTTRIFPQQTHNTHSHTHIPKTMHSKVSTHKMPRSV